MDMGKMMEHMGSMPSKDSMSEKEPMQIDENVKSQAMAKFDEMKAILDKAGVDVQEFIDECCEPGENEEGVDEMDSGDESSSDKSPVKIRVAIAALKKKPE